MGQQQLLLIVLGVIIVGIAVVVGINLFNANAEESAKDTIASEATNLGAMCLQYFKKPLALGGGGNSFAGFVTPPANGDVSDEEARHPFIKDFMVMSGDELLPYKVAKMEETGFRVNSKLAEGYDFVYYLTIR